MTTLNLDESHDFDSEKYLLATQVVDLMTKQFNSKELSDVFPYLQTGGDDKIHEDFMTSIVTSSESTEHEKLIRDTINNNATAFQKDNLKIDYDKIYEILFKKTVWIDLYKYKLLNNMISDGPAKLFFKKIFDVEDKKREHALQNANEQDKLKLESLINNEVKIIPKSMEPSKDSYRNNYIKIRKEINELVRKIEAEAEAARLEELLNNIKNDKEGKIITLANNDKRTTQVQNIVDQFKGMDETNVNNAIYRAINERDKGADQVVSIRRLMAKRYIDSYKDENVLLLKELIETAKPDKIGLNQGLSNVYNELLNELNKAIREGNLDTIINESYNLILSIHSHSTFTTDDKEHIVENILDFITSDIPNSNTFNELFRKDDPDIKNKYTDILNLFKSKFLNFKKCSVCGLKNVEKDGSIADKCEMCMTPLTNIEVASMRIEQYQEEQERLEKAAEAIATFRNRNPRRKTQNEMIEDKRKLDIINADIRRIQAQTEAEKQRVENEKQMLDAKNKIDRAKKLDERLQRRSETDAYVRKKEADTKRDQAKQQAADERRTRAEDRLLQNISMAPGRKLGITCNFDTDCQGGGILGSGVVCRDSDDNKGKTCKVIQVDKTLKGKIEKAIGIDEFDILPGLENYADSLLAFLNQPIFIDYKILDYIKNMSSKDFNEGLSSNTPCLDLRCTSPKTSNECLKKMKEIFKEVNVREKNKLNKSQFIVLNHLFRKYQDFTKKENIELTEDKKGILREFLNDENLKSIFNPVQTGGTNPDNSQVSDNPLFKDMFEGGNLNKAKFISVLNIISNKFKELSKDNRKKIQNFFDEFIDEEIKSNHPDVAKLFENFKKKNTDHENFLTNVSKAEGRELGKNCSLVNKCKGQGIIGSGVYCNKGLCDIKSDIPFKEEIKEALQSVSEGEESQDTTGDTMTDKLEELNKNINEILDKSDDDKIDVKKNIENMPQVDINAGLDKKTICADVFSCNCRNKNECENKIRKLVEDNSKKFKRLDFVSLNKLVHQWYKFDEKEEGAAVKDSLKSLSSSLTNFANAALKTSKKPPVDIGSDIGEKIRTKSATQECGAIVFDSDDIDVYIERLLGNSDSDSPSYCDTESDITFDEKDKGKLKLGGGKMGEAYKTDLPQHPVCKVTPSKLFKKPREITVVDGTDTRIIRKSYPWLNQTLVGLVLMKHMGQTNNVLKNTGAYYVPKKELVPSSDYHNGTGYNFMEQANGDLSKILIELTNQTGRDEENKKHFRDIVLQVLHILRRLQKKCNFVHGDLKDKNIFYIEKSSEELSDTSDINYDTDNSYKGQYKYIIKIADLDKSSCDYETSGKKYRFVPKARDVLGKDGCGLVLNTMKTFNTLDFEKLIGGGIMNIDKLETVCLVRHMPKEMRGKYYSTIVNMGKSFDIFTVMTSLLSYKKVFDVFGEESLSGFLNHVTNKDKYMEILKTEYHKDNKYGFERNPLSKLSEFFRIFKNFKIKIDMCNNLDRIIDSLETGKKAEETKAEEEGKKGEEETGGDKKSGAEEPKAGAETRVLKQNNNDLIERSYTNMYKKRETPRPPPIPGDYKDTYEERHKAEHPKPFKETPEGKVPFEYTSYKSNKPVKDEPEIYIESIMDELNYLEYLIKNDKISERDISQMPTVIRELIQNGNPSKEEVEKMRDIIDISANYKIKKEVDEAQIFDFEGLIDNSSIALSQESVMLNSSIADEFEKFRLNEFQDYQSTTSQNDKLSMEEKEMLQEEIRMLRKQLAQMETVNQKAVDPAPSVAPPNQIEDGVIPTIPTEEKPDEEKPDEEKPQDDFSYDGLIKKQTEPQKKLAEFFKRLDKKYNIQVTEQDKKQKLQDVEKMTLEEYKLYERSVKESLRKNPEYEEIFKKYKKNINKLLELYDDYKFPSYRSIIKDLRDREKTLEYIENALVEKIKKKLDDVTDELDKKYRPSYKNAPSKDKERSIIREKKIELNNNITREFVYKFPEKPKTFFKEEIEGAIANKL